jgi:GR25 family glycosyltransferase involved in LPS biosynthesis
MAPNKENINTLIDKIYVLTIERNSDRHPSVKSILKDISFEFWYGLDAGHKFNDKKYVSDIEDEFFKDNDVDKEFASGSTIGQFGAYLSIKKMIDYIAKSEYEKVLLFEDDMLLLNKDWRNIFGKSLEELPADWDILLLGYFYDGKLYKYSYKRYMRPIITTYNKLRHFLRKKSLIRNLPLKFSKHLDISGYSMGGHAYCLSKKGAQILSAHMTPMRDSGDLLISRLISEKKIKAYSVYPCLFLQDSGFGSKTNTV